MVVMDFPSDSGESVRQRIVASAWVMGHRRIPVIPGQLSPALTPDRHQRRVATQPRRPLPAPDDADEEEIEPDYDTRSDRPR
jgi:hypothetical protein